ncbi:hypothetical protein [Pyrococcus abyssi]|uniref:Uncharacterized protein n=1 Tax=Pyrococcus abyssi (strain GE5 / Orsay) TaxID=272844 RepID=Q9V1M9_PYRAB|nr:hypothetical protein [Pyrococcus abyssi]CAB49320.1 Hypothetical protein PAB2083 [Pyrococcus abyssi GE5]CCE69776.1 TPA: hypothetical protein PAB2083 [Pyrococcus abyssi GE5]
MEIIKGGIDPARLRKLLERALNENQRLILCSLDNNGESKSLTSLAEGISKAHRKPVSTLKLNAKILKELGLIEYGTRRSPRTVRLTEFGKFVIRILGADEVED